MTTFDFTVHGTPAPQGSKRHVGRGIMVESSKALRPWREAIAWHARHARGDHPLLTGPVAVRATFYLPRPQHHYRTNGQLKTTAPLWHSKRGDLDKHARALLDAITGTLIVDDAQVAYLHLRKLYGDPHATVHVAPLTTTHTG